MAATRLEDQWRLLMEEGKTTVERQRLARFYAMLPTATRCRICKMPFAGFSGQVLHLFGKGSSRMNPHLCSDCDDFTRANPGGVEIHLSMLFADIRGSTGLGENLGAGEFTRLIDRFFTTATDILCESNAIIDKLAGDQVSGYFVPGLAGPMHPKVAIQAAQKLIQETGHGDPNGPWIPIGIGVHTGNAFIGTVGSKGRIVDLTALGDAVNVAARLASNARAGEVLVSQEAYAESGLNLGSANSHPLPLKGRAQPIAVISL